MRCEFNWILKAGGNHDWSYTTLAFPMTLIAKKTNTNIALFVFLVLLFYFGIIYYSSVGGFIMIIVITRWGDEKT